MKKTVQPLLFGLTFLMGTNLFQAQAQNDRTVLEKYVFTVGSPNQGPQSSGAGLRFSDRFFGGGTASARIALREQSSSSNITNRPLLLSLDVERTVKPGEVVFALLVFGIEVRGFDSSGSVIYSKDLAPFSFGDSAGGKWHELLPELPTSLNRLEITFYGNYE